jgi:ATP-dependent Clp protease, protease subunit
MNPLLKLLALNQHKGFFKAEKVSDNEDVLYLYDVIVDSDPWGMGGVSALDFVKTLYGMSAPVIHLRINSPGGDVFAARAMAQAIKEHPSTIIAHVDGMAASAATFPVIAADESVISEGGMFMIHNAWTVAAGNAKYFADMANFLSRTDQTLIDDYSKKTGQSAEQIKQWMDEETYFYGQEAVENNFVNAIAPDVVKNSIAWDMSAYNHQPELRNQEVKPLITDKQETKPEIIDLTNHYRRLALIEKTAA